MDIKSILCKEILIFDGAMGTVLQNRGLGPGQIPESLNITTPETIIQIHREYLDAGARVLTTNTFGANEIKLESSEFTVEEIIETGIQNARKAISQRHAFVCLDIGPIGQLLEPMGSLTFEAAYEIFKRQILAGVKSGADLILIETMTDLYEAKAAILAAKENSKLPVFCTMSFEENLRTFTGCGVDSMVMVLQGLGVDALGINCSLGPKEMEPALNRVLELAKVPVMVQPNAGLPIVRDGITYYDFPPEKFAGYITRFVQNGVKIVGGCCGTDKNHINSLYKSIKDIKPVKREPINIYGVCTPNNPVFIDGVKVIGERINPTGKKDLQKALKSEDLDYVIDEAIDQVEAGADILDINIGLPKLNEEELMVKIIKKIQSVLNVPLQIDSKDIKAIESGLRVYNGKAIVNSVTGEDKSLDTILPIARKYGAAVIGLTMDEDGIPASAEDRLKIATKIIKRAKEFGIAKEDIYIDCLTLTAAAQQKGVKETLKALKLVKKELGVKTTLGVSNISFGLPNRSLLNKTFLVSSLTAGLDMPIIDPLSKEMMDTLRAYKVLWNEDTGADEYIKCYADIDEKLSKPKKKIRDVLCEKSLCKAIIDGSRDEAKDIAKRLMTTKPPLKIIDEDIIPALDVVGEKYETGEVFLPQLIQSAETVKEAFQVIKDALGESPTQQITRRKILLATVEGDMHDIGKNIVKVLLESYGFDVLDLGKDVKVETVVEKTLENDIELVGLSALMTTTVRNMERTIDALKAEKPGCKIMVGGAPLTEEYAKSIGADFYAKDAQGAVTIARKVIL